MSEITLIGIERIITVDVVVVASRRQFRGCVQSSCLTTGVASTSDPWSYRVLALARPWNGHALLPALCIAGAARNTFNSSPVILKAMCELADNSQAIHPPPAGYSGKVLLIGHEGKRRNDERAT